MQYSFRRLIITIVVAVAVISGQVMAETDSQVQQDQLMQKMREMIKNSGVDPATQKQVEAMMNGMAQEGTNAEAAKLKNKQLAFNAETSGNGTARVEINGQHFELVMTECTISDRNNNEFTLQAKQAPGLDGGRLWVTGSGSNNGNLGFYSDSTGTSEAQQLSLLLNDSTLVWQGTVATNKGNTTMSVHLNCGAEVIDHTARSESKPETAVNVFTLKTGEEEHTLHAGYCTTTEYRDGNLIIEAEATATGTFRGRPAIALVSRAHPVDSQKTFQKMELLLGELTIAQRVLPPLKVSKQLRDTVAAFEKKEMDAVRKKYPAEMFNSVPPAEIGAVISAQSKDYANVSDQVKAMRYPRAISHGAITINAQDIYFHGARLSSQDGSREPALNDLPDETELWITCKD